MPQPVWLLSPAGLGVQPIQLCSVPQENSLIVSKDTLMSHSFPPYVITRLEKILFLRKHFQNENYSFIQFSRHLLISHFFPV